MTDYEHEPQLTVPNNNESVRLQEKVLEIGMQIGGIIMSLEEAGLPRPGYVERFYPEPKDEDGSQNLNLWVDDYPGRGVIRPVTVAEVKKLDNGLWSYSRYTETSHSGDGARSSEAIDATDADGIRVRHFSYPGYSRRPISRATEYNSKNVNDRPLVEDALGKFSETLDRWHQTAMNRITKRGDDLPLQFKYNILPSKPADRANS